MVRPGGGRTGFGYDLAGRLTARTDPDGRTVRFEYDLTDRLVRKLLPGGEVVTYTYTATDRRASVTDARGTTAYEYDAADRLTRRVEPDGTAISHAYDPAGNLLTTTTPAGATAYEYDAAGRLAAVTGPAGGVTRYEYDAAGRPARTARPNGTVETRSYDPAGRLAVVEDRDAAGAVLARFAYTRTPAGDPLTVTAADGRTVTYAYDPDGRLTGETTAAAAGGTRTVTYAYAPAGNRVARTDSAGGTTTYTYDADDRLLVAAGADARVSTYDASGNTLSVAAGGRTTGFTWDAEHRLTAATVTDAAGTLTAAYAYDADGLRVRTTAGGVESRYLLDTTGPYAQVATEYAPDGTLRASYVSGTDRLSRTAGGATTYYLSDGHSGVRATTDAAGAVVGRADYDAYGVPLAAGPAGDPFGYRGEATDPLTGLQYLRARWYDPATGRFASRDPFPGLTAQPLTRQPYLYGLDNPVRHADPSGKLPFTIPYLLAGIAVIGGLTAIVQNAVAGAIGVGGSLRDIIWNGSFTEAGLGALGVEGDIAYLRLQSAPVRVRGGQFEKGNGDWLFLGLGLKVEILQLALTKGDIQMRSPGLIGLTSLVFAPFYSLFSANAFVVFEGGSLSKLYAGFGQSTAAFTDVSTNSGFALPAAGVSGGIVIPLGPLDIRPASPPRR